MSTSFVKKISTTPQLYKDKVGVKPATNGLYTVSTGNSSLDSVIGGGIAIGSITMLYEDSMSAFYSHFQKTYLAEGIVRKQKCLVVDNDVFKKRDFWLKFLPAVAEVKPVEE